ALIEAAARIADLDELVDNVHAFNNFAEGPEAQVRLRRRETRVVAVIDEELRRRRVRLPRLRERERAALERKVARVIDELAILVGFVRFAPIDAELRYEARHDARDRRIVEKTRGHELEETLRRVRAGLRVDLDDDIAAGRREAHLRHLRQ